MISEGTAADSEEDDDANDNVKSEKCIHSDGDDDDDSDEIDKFTIV